MVWMYRITFSNIISDIDIDNSKSDGVNGFCISDRVVFADLS